MFSDKEAKSWYSGTKGRTWRRKQSIYFYVCTLTFLSKSLSHMSLIVHPAPLISKAPTPKSASMRRSGRHPGSAASPILHVQGRYSSHVPTRTQQFIFHWNKEQLATKRTSWKTTHYITVSHELSSPMGLSSLINLRYGWTDAGAAFTIPAGVRLKNLLPLLWPASKGGHILCLWPSLLLKQDPDWQKAVVMFSCCLLRLERRAEQICGRLLLTACGWSSASSLVDIILSVELSWPTFSKRCHDCKAARRFIVYLHSCANEGALHSSGTMNLTIQTAENTIHRLLTGHENAKLSE